MLCIFCAFCFAEQEIELRVIKVYSVAVFVFVRFCVPTAPCCIIKSVSSQCVFIVQRHKPFIIVFDFQCMTYDDRAVLLYEGFLRGVGSAAGQEIHRAEQET